jgi:hypothetical protein
MRPLPPQWAEAGGSADRTMDRRVSPDHNLSPMPMDEQAILHRCDPCDSMVDGHGA